MDVFELLFFVTVPPLPGVVSLGVPPVNSRCETLSPLRTGVPGTDTSPLLLSRRIVPVRVGVPLM